MSELSSHSYTLDMDDGDRVLVCTSEKLNEEEQEALLEWMNFVYDHAKERRKNE